MDSGAETPNRRLRKAPAVSEPTTARLPPGIENIIASIQPLTVAAA